VGGEGKRKRGFVNYLRSGFLTIKVTPISSNQEWVAAAEILFAIPDER
jgi:hypothetical protein